MAESFLCFQNRFYLKILVSKHNTGCYTWDVTLMIKSIIFAAQAVTNKKYFSDAARGAIFFHFQLLNISWLELYVQGSYINLKDRNIMA